ncbi:unnamed protein product, partial [marine sediment metagenome]
FQTGQSKNQRGCICNAIPRWLINQAVEAAKAASKKDAGHDTDGKLTKALSSFNDKGITEADLLGYFGKKSIEEFDIKIVAQLRNLWVQLQNKETSVEAIKRQGQDVFDEPKQTRTKKIDPKKYGDKAETKTKPADKIKDVKKDPQSDMGKAPAKKAADTATLMQTIKSFEFQKIFETELCAYFGVDDLAEMDTPEGLVDLQKIAFDIKGGAMTPEEFKKQAAERFEMRRKEER